MKPLISVIIIDSRSHVHPDWVDKSISSVKNQSIAEKVELIVVDNKDRSSSIGKLWNEGMELAKADWVFFLGDDDYISPDYLASLIVFINEFAKEEVVVCSTYCCIFDEEKKIMTAMAKAPSGCFRREYFLDHKFDETLVKHIDIDAYDRVRKDDKNMLVCKWHFGYYYRQHEDNVSGKKNIEVIKEISDSFPKLKGSVALVGNAKSILDYKHGAKIDSYDNVIRFGDAITKGYEEQVGSKETYRFLCYPSGENGFEDTLSGKKIFLMADNSKLLLDGVKRLINRNEIYFISKDFRTTCNKLTGKMCSLGMMAIQGFLDYKPDLYGFDFFKTLHYHQDLKTDPHICHNWNKEREMVEHLDNKNLVKWIK